MIRQIYRFRKLLSKGVYGNYTFSNVDERILSSSPIRQISLLKEVSVTSIFSLSGRREIKEEMWKKFSFPGIFKSSKIYLSSYSVERFSHLNYYDRFLPLLKEEKIFSYPYYFPSSIYEYSKYRILPSHKVLKRYGKIIALGEDHKFLFQHFYFRSSLFFSLTSDLLSLYLFS